jgi:hypothetical protein
MRDVRFQEAARVFDIISMFFYVVLVAVTIVPEPPPN